jgi:hypothetical protein
MFARLLLSVSCIQLVLGHLSFQNIDALNMQHIITSWATFVLFRLRLVLKPLVNMYLLGCRLILCIHLGWSQFSRTFAQIILNSIWTMEPWEDSKMYSFIFGATHLWLALLQIKVSPYFVNSTSMTKYVVFWLSRLPICYRCDTPSGDLPCFPQI